jgi:hypothetical protein
MNKNKERFLTKIGAWKDVPSGIPRKYVPELISQIKLLLHASRDCLRNRGKDATKIRFEAFDCYYAEAFGILRSLTIFGYAEFGYANIPGGLCHWFDSLANEVLEEEGFGKNNQCDYCYKHFGKDSVRIR